jgi:hypothetical protein
MEKGKVFRRAGVVSRTYIIGSFDWWGEESVIGKGVRQSLGGKEKK